LRPICARRIYFQEISFHVYSCATGLEIGAGIAKDGDSGPGPRGCGSDQDGAFPSRRGVRVTLASQTGTMRAFDHQFQQPLVVAVMDRQGEPGVKFDVEGSGYNFRVIKTIAAADAEQVSTCKMQRPVP
jgi:hypothetical protein